MRLLRRSSPAVRPSVAIAAIVRDEAPDLLDWIGWHLALGVEHVVLYDNGSRDATPAVLRPLEAAGLVTRISWPGRARQLDAYAHAADLLGSRWTWLAFIDADELIVPHRDPDIPAFLARHAGADQVLLPMREIGFSGHRTRPDAPVFRAFTTAHREMPRTDGGRKVRVKGIVRPRAIREVRIHGCRTISGRSVDPGGRPVAEGGEGRPFDPALFAVAQLNHYYTRSWEDWERKRARGSAAGSPDRPDLPFDLPGEEDRSALRFAAAAEARIAELRALDPDPWRMAARTGGVTRPNRFVHDARLALVAAAGRDRDGRDGGPAAVEAVDGGAGVRLLLDAASPTVMVSGAPAVTDLVARMGGRVIARGPGVDGGPVELAIPGERPEVAVVGVVAEAAAAGTLRIAPDPGASLTVALPAAGRWAVLVECGEEPRVLRALRVEPAPGVRLLDLVVALHP